MNQDLNTQKIPKRILNSLLLSVSAGVVPRMGAPYIAIGRGEEIEALGLKCDIVTRDLHASEWNEGNVMTEYETAFSEQGMKINMLEVTKPAGFSPELPTELSRDRKVFYK